MKIHTVWVGSSLSRMPTMNKMCLDDWRKQGYEVKIWQEKDTQHWIDANSYIKRAYSKGVWSIVSDYLRLKVLELEGGLYIDTDVTILKDPTELFDRDFVMCYECARYACSGVVYADKDSAILKKLVHFYENDIEKFEERMAPIIFTRFMNEHPNKDDYKILPIDYFYPYGQDGVMRMTENSYLVHWWQHSWSAFDLNAV